MKQMIRWWKKIYNRQGVIVGTPKIIELLLKHDTASIRVIVRVKAMNTATDCTITVYSKKAWKELRE